MSSLLGVGGAAGNGHRDRVEGTSKGLTRTRSNEKEEDWWGLVGRRGSWFKKRRGKFYRPCLMSCRSRQLFCVYACTPVQDCPVYIPVYALGVSDVPGVSEVSHLSPLSQSRFPRFFCSSPCHLGPDPRSHSFSSSFSPSRKQWHGYTVTQTNGRADK